MRPWLSCEGEGFVGLKVCGEERSTMKTIRFAQLSDAPALLSIYAHYVENSVITFEYDVPSLDSKGIPVSGM